MKKKLLFALLLLGLLSTACNLARYAPVAKGQPLTPTLPSSPPLAPRANAASPATPAPTETSLRVCTGYPTGALNVRTCPGMQCWAFFVLDEGRVVAVDGATEQADDGATWAHLIRPVDGWVNARYLCEVKP